MPEAARTLVKSPPELWAEVSDPTALARHLGAFGDIRITRLEPEATVAWEGDRASGTVALEPTGWGTKVTVAAETVDAGGPVEASPVAGAPHAAAETPAPVEEPAPPEGPPPAEELPPAAEALPPAAEEPRQGFLARLFRRRPKATPVAEAPTVEAPAVRAPTAEAPTVEAPGDAERRLVRAEGEQLDTRSLEGAEPEAPAVDADAVLTEMLANLGAAHHRPFSRG